MATNIFGDLAIRSASMALDGLSMRQQVIANNVANVDTPGFKAGRVSFEQQLQRALQGGEQTGLSLKTTTVSHLRFSPTADASLATITSLDNQLRNDENNVDIDIEMTSLAETTLRYQAISQLASRKLGVLKSIVRGGV